MSHLLMFNLNEFMKVKSNVPVVCRLEGLVVVDLLPIQKYVYYSMLTLYASVFVLFFQIFIFPISLFRTPTNTPQYVSQHKIV